MDDDAWGTGDPPLTTADSDEPLPPRLAALAAVTERVPLPPGEPWRFPAADELPEVRRMRAAGFRPLEPAPLWAGLPAVWPREHRGWVPDRLPRVLVHGHGEDGRRWVAPWDEWLHAEAEEEAAGLARELGLPPPPAGRIWLLRSPWPSLGLAVVLRLLGHHCAEQGLPLVHTGLVRAAREVLHGDDARAEAALPEDLARAAGAWREAGRVGEDVADLVARGLGPDEQSRLAALGLDEVGALAWVDAVGATGPTGVDLVADWLRVVPVETVTRHPSLLLGVEPSEVARWLTAGFALDDLRGDVSLEAALVWRAVGVGPGEATRVLRADPELTPEEARAFEVAGLHGEERLAWIEHGFDAAAARAWRHIGLFPNEARVWRSVGISPEDARESVTAGALLPSLAGPLGWASLRGDAREHRHYQVPDPPGTRGRIAADGHRRGYRW